NRVLYMDPLKPIFFEGNFSRFLAWQQERNAALGRQRDKLQQAIDHKQNFVDRFRYKARKAAQAQSRLKQIKHLEQEKEALVQPRLKKSLDFSWPTPPRINAVPVSGVDLAAPYPAGAPLFTGLSFQLRRGQKVALAGPNGCGKTTLLKIISAGLTPGAGSVHIGSMVSMASFSQQTAEMLDTDKTVLSQIRALTGPGIKEQELASVLGLFLFGRDFWDQRIASLSGGEKSRLILASLFVSNANLLILDEPTNHLDIESREALIQALKLYRGTLLFVAHDRSLLSEVAREIWYLGPRGLDILHEGYQAYEHKMAANRQGPSFQEKGPEQLQRSKEQKRQDARTRNERFRLLKPLKNEYSDLETRFDALLQKMETVEQALAASETYTDGELVKRLNQEYRGHQQESESLLQQMETLERKIDVIEKEQNTTLSG
ncbi:MAG: ATP-binding cassette domain-containing protein, partial [Desulfohalobiaceae bacterium]|nr:ATP-binding cassette domain-containing protein [Desulfohalobiaceae bacterium]